VPPPAAGSSVPATMDDLASSPPGARIYETVLYAPDVAAAAAFYERLGFALAQPPNPLMAVVAIPGGSVLLIFDPSRSEQPGRDVPSHGARGPGHVAFRVAPEALDRRRAELAAGGVEIEREMTWGGGARSVYVRDPAGNSVEFIDGDIWPYPEPANG
jgi:catechol 2,3-dioxygenase-like lactoylglutathione lyase family enzyme